MGERRILRVTLETVTPLLLGGADGKTPELRVPPFRGAMRYWWRAALGGIIGDSNLEALHKLESAVFGSPDLGSAISIRLGSSDTFETQVPPLPHKKHKFKRKALVGSFELVMSQPRSADALIWNAACASLELALTSGGVGLRSRRGYGTVRVVKASGSRVVAFPTTFDGWRSHVRRVTQLAIRAAVELAEACNVPLSLAKSPAAYPCATHSGLIRLCDVKVHSAMEAMKLFMNRVQKDKALGGINPRQASPLWVRPIQTGPTTYGLLCTVLTSKFPGSNYDFVHKFLDDKFRGQYLRVKGWNA